MKRGLIICFAIAAVVAAGVFGTAWLRPNEDTKTEHRLKEQISLMRTVMDRANVKIEPGKYNLVRTNSVTRPYTCVWETQMRGYVSAARNCVDGDWVIEMYYDRDDRVWVVTSARSDTVTDADVWKYVTGMLDIRDGSPKIKEI